MKSAPVRTVLALAIIGLLTTGCQSPLSKAYRGLDGDLRDNRCAMYRIETELAKTKDVSNMYGYELLDGPIWVSAKVSRRLSLLFCDPANYRMELVPDLGLCGFEPFAIARFGELDLLVSLACDKIQIRHGGKIVNMVDVTPMHDKALPVMRTVFFDDTYVKLLQPLRKHGRLNKKAGDDETE